MFKLDGPEPIILLAIIMWFLGTDKAKKLARRVGEGAKEIKKFQQEIEDDKEE